MGRIPIPQNNSGHTSDPAVVFFTNMLAFSLALSPMCPDTQNNSLSRFFSFPKHFQTNDSDRRNCNALFPKGPV